MMSWQDTQSLFSSFSVNRRVPQPAIAWCWHWTRPRSHRRHLRATSAGWYDSSSQQSAILTFRAHAGHVLGTSVSASFCRLRVPQTLSRLSLSQCADVLQTMVDNCNDCGCLPNYHQCRPFSLFSCCQKCLSLLASPPWQVQVGL